MWLLKSQDETNQMSLVYTPVKHIEVLLNNFNLLNYVGINFTCVFGNIIDASLCTQEI